MPMQNLIATLRSLSLVDASATDLVAQLTRHATAIKSELAGLQLLMATQARHRAEAHVGAAVRAGRLPA